jgi:rubrerythrin
MPFRTLLTGLLLESESSVVVECRRCGTNVSRRTERCPNCEGAEFSRYEFPG